MNFLVLSKIYKILEGCIEECQNSNLKYLKLKNYEELKKTLEEYNYDYTPGQILIDVKYGSNIEEAMAEGDSLFLTCDNTKIEYSQVQILMRMFCAGGAVIKIKDDKMYCEKCFEMLNNQVSYQTIKNIINSKDETYGLSTTSKIEYILVKNKGNPLSAYEIYDLGSPWDLKTFTPRNSVYARLSSLCKKGLIERRGSNYCI